jgi:hypothetical protein
MKYITILIIGLFAFSSYAQTNEDTITFGRIGELTIAQIDNSGASKLMFISDNIKARELARVDIQNGMAFLLLAGGIAPTIIDTDPEFERKYKVYFYEFGCTGPDYELIIAYNQVVFEYLNKQYGKKWQKEVRNDVVGLKDWRKK